MKSKQIFKIYKKLYRHFGPQYWWPAETRLEVIVGAVLTQNTAWANVERAIVNLKRNKLLSLKKLQRVNSQRLAKTIKPAGYFNLKAKRLKNVIRFLVVSCLGKTGRVSGIKTSVLRRELLGVNGIGPETADSILLYAWQRPVFVVDAYTKRIFSRLQLINSAATYEEIQATFMANLKCDTKLFNEYHALIVMLGKEYCRRKPKCRECPLLGDCR